MRVVTFEQVNQGGILAVNPALVCIVKQNGEDRTLICTTDGNSYMVGEPVMSVIERLGESDDAR